MIRTAWPQDLPVLRALFADANDAPYDLAGVAEEKCFAPGVSGPPVARLFEQGGRIAGASVICGKWLRVLVVARSERGRGIGSELLRDAEEHGASVVAAEGGNYFTPGVLTSDARTCGFFHARRYIETRWTCNLEVSLADLPGSDAPPGAAIRRPTREEADGVLDFVGAQFGRIWRFEAAKAFARDTPPAFISEEEGAITGFAVHDVNNRGLGWFGPTGVLLSRRGRGIGAALLNASLSDLREMGYGKAVIPWTDAIDFYRKACGAEPAHRFIAFAKRQP